MSLSAFGGFYYTPGLTYGEGFAYTYICTTLVWGGTGLGAACLLYLTVFLIKKYSRKSRYNTLRDSESGRNSEIQSNSSYHPAPEGQRTSTKKKIVVKAVIVKILLVLSYLFSWFGFFAITIAPSISSGLGVIPVWAGAIITFLLWVVKYIELIFAHSPRFLSKDKQQSSRSLAERFWRRIKVTTQLHKIGFGIFWGCAVVYCVAVPLMTEGTCLNFYNEGSYGVEFDTGFGLSTKFSRYFELDTVCPEGSICHLYATLPEDGSTAVILNVHTGTDITTLQVGYDDKNFTAQSYYLDMETRGDRYMHSVYISGLTSNTQYEFNIYINGQIAKTATYLTLPSSQLERVVFMAAGGDVGTEVDAREMTAVLGQQSQPVDVILIGGDLGYDNGIRSCYYSLDLFINMFEKIDAQNGRLTPLMTTVGNHDVGFNAFQGTQIDITQNLYMTYFPQHSTVDADGNLLYQVPDLADRLSYHSHVVGNSIFLSLDSGYLLDYESQIDWINKTVQSTPNVNLIKYATFHVPMYPTCFSPDYDDPRTISLSREQWAPLFESNKFTAIFENHVHLYKKTVPIKNNTQVAPGEGVVYFGDGNWGISADACWYYPDEINGNTTVETGLLETFNKTRHIWLINMTNETLYHWAVNEENKIFDQVYNFTVSDYVNVPATDL